MLYVHPKNIDLNKSCWACKHLNQREENDADYDYSKHCEGEIYCIAFPNEIPSEIYNNGHFEPRPDLGQKNDIVYEPRED